MMNPRSSRGSKINGRLFVVLALFLFTAGGFWTVMKDKASGVNIAVAKADMTPGTALSKDAFAYVSLPGSASDIPDNFVTESELTAMVERSPVLLSEMKAGDYLRDSDVYAAAYGADGKAIADYEPGRLTELLRAGQGRIISIEGDATTTFAKAGDRLDVYRVTGGGDFLNVELCFSKKILYVIPRIVPTGTAANGYTPSGTNFVLDFDLDASGVDVDGHDASDIAAAIIKLQEDGRMRVALGSPTSTAQAGGCSDLFPAEIAPSPAPSPTPSPSSTTTP